MLYAGEPGVQLTWMDAKIGDWVVTPRPGKAVEVNALGYNALKIMAALSKQFHIDSDVSRFSKNANQVKNRFLELFWDNQNDYLYDFVDDEHQDAALRPNQIFALSLPFPLLTGKKASRAIPK